MQKQKCDHRSDVLYQKIGRSFSDIFYRYYFSLYPVEAGKRAKVDFLLNWDLGSLYKAIGEMVYPVVFKKEPLCEEKKKAFSDKVQFMNDHFLKVSFFVKFSA